MFTSWQQVSYAARRGAHVIVFPELWCFKRGEVEQDPKAAAAYSADVLEACARRRLRQTRQTHVKDPFSTT